MCVVFFFAADIIDLSKEMPLKGILTLAADPFILLMVSAQVVANRHVLL